MSEVNFVNGCYGTLGNRCLETWISNSSSSLDAMYYNQSDPPPFVKYHPARLPPYDWFYMVISVLVIFGVTGNVLVCLAVSLDQKLHNLTNYFLLSLAIADLLVCLVVMPFGAIAGFLGYWPFPVVWCNIYVTCDVLGCSCSIMHMCFMSVGRYMGIRNPLKTRRLSKKQTMTKIALCWLLSMVITSPLTVLAAVEPTTVMNNNLVCVISNNYYKILASAFSFYIPMLVMVITYVLTLCLLQKKANFYGTEENRRIMQANCRAAAAAFSSSSNREPGRCDPSASQVLLQTKQDGLDAGGDSSARLPLMPRGAEVPDGRCDRSTQTEKDSSSSAGAAAAGSCGVKSLKRQLNCVASSLPFLQGRQRRHSFSVLSTMANESKASKVLGLIFLAFIICWVPFFVLNVFSALCSQCRIASILFDLFLWLGYTSSTLNPIIYTIFNENFRKAFLRLIKCNCNPEGHHQRSSSFQGTLHSPFSLASIAANSGSQAFLEQEVHYHPRYRLEI